MTIGLWHHSHSDCPVFTRAPHPGHVKSITFCPIIPSSPTTFPVFEEIKWSDLWSKRRGKPRNEFIADIDVNTLREYFDSIIKMTENIDSLKIILSVTKNTEENYIHRDAMVRFHLQEAFQRVNRDLKRNGFAVFIIDELPDDYSKRTKEMLASG